MSLSERGRLFHVAAGALMNRVVLKTLVNKNV